MAATEYLPLGIYADHSPVVTTLFGNTASFPKPFKFFNFWLKHDRFNELMEENWRVNVHGLAQFVLAERGRLFKQHLKSFNFTEFSELSKRTKEAVDLLAELQKRADIDTTNLDLRSLIKTQRQKAAYLEESERGIL